MTEATEAVEKGPDTLLKFIGAMPIWQRYAVIGTLATGSGLSINGVWQFLKDAPAVVSRNTSEIRMHHDTLVELSQVVDAVQIHLGTSDTAIGSIDRKLDYLVCLRTERARELAGDPSIRDCELELLER